MITRPSQDDGRTVRRLRVAIWATAGVLLLAPVIAMRFTAEVRWDGADMALFAVLLLGAGGAFEWLARSLASLAYRAAAALALAGAALLIVANGAVGIVGSEANDLNLAYFAVPVIGLIGATVSRLNAGGMARTMVAVALAQVAIGVAAVLFDQGTVGEVIPGTLPFTALWLLSAWLFGQAECARGAQPRSA